MQKLPFYIGEYARMCRRVCRRGREFLIQGFVYLSFSFIHNILEVVNSVTLKACLVLPSGMIRCHFTCIKFCPNLPYWWGTFGYLTSPDIFASHPLTFLVNSHGFRYYEGHTWVQQRQFVVLQTWIVAEQMTSQEIVSHFPYLPSPTTYITCLPSALGFYYNFNLP